MSPLYASHPRYQGSWLEPFRASFEPGLVPGAVILDVGGGRSPAVPRASLPTGARYVGLDLSRRELDAAPDGTYDERVEADITRFVAGLEGTVDLAISWQVLEHVHSVPAAIENVHRYLRPGGLFVAHLSGGRSAFGLINRALPHPLVRLAMRHLLRRDPETVFPAPYDHCTFSGLVATTSGWSRVRIVPRYRGAQYFRFFAPLEWLYLRFEDLIVRGRHRDLATHYLLVLEK